MPTSANKPCALADPRVERQRASWVDLMAAGFTEPRCASERGLAMGGGRPAERRFTVGVAANPWLGAIARCSRTGRSYGAGGEDGNFVAGYNRWSAVMRLPNDLSRSLVALDQNSTII